MSENAGPYSNHTLMALAELVRETRRLCFAMERLDSPIDIAERLRDLRPFYGALASELAHDYKDKIEGLLLLRGLSANTRAFLFIAASAAAAFVLVYFGEAPS